ncbi:unnamed protein product [Durusdinium trenchii]|uniref:Secreted protein n=1 Tax=Durusdinium trenchii TaxID=1381693 RepID=A0ABP0LVE1_9DINO
MLCLWVCNLLHVAGLLLNNSSKRTGLSGRTKGSHEPCLTDHRSSLADGKALRLAALNLPCQELQLYFLHFVTLGRPRGRGTLINNPAPNMIFLRLSTSTENYRH